MCGICGVFYFDPQHRATDAEVRRMRDVQFHRGPDGAGLHLEGPVGLGHRRLSIIDVQGGAQPLSNEDGSVWISFNGEIYNYPALMRELKSSGHHFQTSSDTEVVVHLYEELGSRCVESLNGIFAFAIWDSNRKTLLLARDRLGIKPLHYHRGTEALFFASEIKGVLAADGVACVPNVSAIREYLTFRHVFGRRTLFDGIDALEPGTFLEVDSRGVRQTRYWRVDPGAYAARTDCEWEECTESLLAEAVRMQMISDVPLGTFCSGGIDSSLVTALAAKATAQPLNTYTIGYRLADWDERPFARLVTDRYGAIAGEIEIDGAEFAEAVRTLHGFNDEPLTHPSSIPLFLLSGLARRSVKVVLSGEGSDEAFMGYPRHLIVATHRWISAIAGDTLRAGVGWMARVAPTRRARMLGRGLRGNLRDAILFNAAFVEAKGVDALVSAEVPDDGLSEREAALATVDTAHPLLGLARYELETYLPIALDRLDRMTMAQSLEARVPFLDHRLVELALALPMRLKLRGGTNKWLIRRIARKHLPNPVIHRRKVGFGVPLSVWLRELPILRDAVRDLSNSTLVREGLLKRDEIKRLGALHLRGHENHAEVLWLLINLTWWYEDLPRRWPTREGL
jgi:asparagine synthase (glutamine-hydrolysing)